jgi:hypothetical protein
MKDDNSDKGKSTKPISGVIKRLAIGDITEK